LGRSSEAGEEFRNFGYFPGRVPRGVPQCLKIRAPRLSGITRWQLKPELDPPRLSGAGIGRVNENRAEKNAAYKPGKVFQDALRAINRR
jgi:hypothetical protein